MRDGELQPSASAAFPGRTLERATSEHACQQIGPVFAIELMRHLGDSKRVPTEPPLVFRYSPHFRFDPLWDVQMLQG